MGDGKGAATIFRTLKAFNDAGHTVNLVVPESGKRHAADGTVDRLERVRLWGLRSFASSGDRRVTSLPGRVWAKLRLSVLFPLLAARQGLRILRQEKIDVLYGYEVQGVLAVRLLRRLRRLPTVARFQGWRGSLYERLLSHHGRLENAGWNLRRSFVALMSAQLAVTDTTSAGEVRERIANMLAVATPLVDTIVAEAAR